MGDIPWFMWTFWGYLVLLVPLYGLWFWRLLTDSRAVLASEAEIPRDLNAALRTVRRRFAWMLVGLNGALLLGLLGVLVAMGVGWTELVATGSILAVVCVLGAFAQS